MPDNLAQLDQGGSNAQWTKVYLGPTIGWQWLPAGQQRIITSTAALTIQPYDSRIILKAAVTAIQLPDLNVWVTYAFQQVRSGFDRELWIKDLTGNFAVNNCVVTPFGTQKIDNQATLTLISNHALARLYPLTDLSGWYVG